MRRCASSVGLNHLPKPLNTLPTRKNTPNQVGNDLLVRQHLDMCRNRAGANMRRGDGPHQSYTVLLTSDSSSCTCPKVLEVAGFRYV